jgi:sec-independent protein translocase protein TatA
MFTDILQPTHLLLILVVALLVLGPKRLPEVGRQIGNGLRDFRNAINGEHESFRDAINFDTEKRHPVVEESFSYGDPPKTSETPSSARSGADSGDRPPAEADSGSDAGASPRAAGPGSERPDAAV